MSEDGRRRSQDSEPQPYDGKSPQYEEKKGSGLKVLGAFVALAIFLLIVQAII